MRYVISPYLGSDVEAGIKTILTHWVGSFNISAQLWVIWEERFEKCRDIIPGQCRNAAFLGIVADHEWHIGDTPLRTGLGWVS